MPRDYESHSSVSTYTLCPKRYEYTYIEGYETANKSNDLRMGSTWGYFLEHKRLPNDAPLSRRDFGLLEILAEGYTGMYGDENLQHEVEVEHNGIRGKIDAVGSDYIVESKLTRSRVDWQYWEQRKLDQQVMLYIYLARKNGIQAKYAIYDVVRRPMQRPRRSESEANFLNRVRDEVYARRHEYFQRRKLEYTDSALLHNFENMQRIIGSMPIAGDTFHEHRNSCRAYGNICEFMPVCTGEEKLKGNEELYVIRQRS